jgi:hypothetical protein
MRRTISGMTAAPLSTLCFVAVVAPTCPPTNLPPSSRMILIHGKEGGQHSTSNLKSLSENFERQLNFGLKPALTPALSMNLDFMVVQTVLVYGLHSQLVVTTALILTFSPEEKGQRLHASLHAVVRRANPVAGDWWFRGSRREFFGEISPGEGETVSVALRNHAFGWLKTLPRPNCQSNTFHHFQTVSEPIFHLA